MEMIAAISAERCVSKAVENINTAINDVLAGMDASDIYAVDAAMLKADGTRDKSKSRSQCDPGSLNRLRRKRRQPCPWIFRYTDSLGGDSVQTGCRFR